MKYQVCLSKEHGMKKGGSGAFVSVKFKDGESPSLAGAVTRAVQSNIGKRCTVSVQADMQEGVPAAAVVCDRYGNKTAYTVTVNAA